MGSNALLTLIARAIKIHLLLMAALSSAVLVCFNQMEHLGWSSLSTFSPLWIMLLSWTIFALLSWSIDVGKKTLETKHDL